MTTKLTPPNLKQCQAEKPNGNNFMTLGGPVGMEQCTNLPTVIATESKADESGVIGSMALCSDCAAVLKKQLGEDYATFKDIGDGNDD